MILNPHRNTSPLLAKSRLGFITSAAALLAALAIYAAPRLVLADPPPPPASAPPSPPEVPAPADLAINGEPSATPLEVDPGPKAKSGNSTDEATEAISIAPPVAPTLPTVSVAQPKSVNGPRVPYVAATPRPPKDMAAADADASIEQRLRRLEKMVELLVEQRETKGFESTSRNEGPRGEIRTERETAQLQQTAKREADRAAEQAKRAAKDADKAMKLQQERHAHDMAKESTAKQLDALHKQRAALERHMKDLQLQIERLEQDQQKLQEKQPQRNESF